MHPEDKLKQIFADSLQTQQMSASLLAEHISSAALLMTQSLLSGGKLLCYGDGRASLIARQFCHNMLHGLHTPRPALPALLLDDVAGPVHMLNALGQHNDILLLASFDGEGERIAAAIETAQQRELHLVALTARNGGHTANVLRHHDIEIRIPADEDARILESQCVVVNCLCQLIDQQLLGQ